MQAPIPINPSPPRLAARPANGHNEGGGPASEGAGVGGARGGMIAKIVSGGQTGVDRAALDVALELGLPCGGWCPKGRRSEGGRIPERYPLRETTSAAYPARTRRNVLYSDGTLVLTNGPPTGGTALTIEL